MVKMNPVKEGIRRYIYKDGETQTFYNVTAVGVRESGYHMLNCGVGDVPDEVKYIVKPGWSTIELKDAEWAF